VAGSIAGTPNGPSPGWHACLMRVAIRVRPGARSTVVGGSHAGALVVRVRERAVDGKATASALAALANALGLRVREVALLSGATSRTKLVEIPDTADIDFAKLLGGSRSLDDT
jgi:uncharacterized protein YggU (UPF0235/DUF167 family)